VIVDEKIWIHLRRALERYIIDINPKWDPPRDFHRFLVDSEVVKVIKSLDEHIDKILEKVPKTYKPKVKRVLTLLSRNIDKTLEYVNNPPDWLRIIAVINMLSDFNVPVFPRLMLEKHVEDLARNVPFTADIYYRGDKIPNAMVLYPDDNELKEMSFNVAEAYEEFISILSSRHVLVPEKHSVRLYEYEIFFPRLAYYKILDRLKKSDIIKKMVEEDLQDVLQELKAFGTITHSAPTIIEVNLSKTILDQINKLYGINIKNAIVVISLTPSERRGSVRVNAEVDSPLGYRKFTVAYGHPAICVSGKCNNVPEHEIMFSDYSEIPKTVKIAIERTAELVAYTKTLMDKFVEEAQRHGYTISEVSYPEAYYSFSTIKAVKNLAHTRASLTMSIEYSTAKPTIFLEASLPLQRTPSTNLAAEALLRIGERVDDYNIRSHRGWTISRKTKFGIDEIGDAFKKATEIAEALETVYEEFMHEKELKKSVKIPVEHYVAIYLTNSLGSGSWDRIVINVEKALGRPFITVYGVVRSVVSKYAPDAVEHVGDHPTTVAYKLFTSRYITIDTNLGVYINGQRYTDIVINYGLSPTEADAKEKSIALTLIKQHIYNKPSKSVVESLNEVGLLHDNVISLLLSEEPHLFKPNDMAVEVNGKPLWHQLSPQTKALYLIKASINDLATILFDPTLREIFSDVIDRIKSEVLSSREPSIITRYAVEYMPGVLGLPKNAKIVSEGKLYAIDVGPFIVQLWRVGDEYNEYIVYNKNSKVGFLFKGKTVMDAINEAIERYDKIYSIFNELFNIAKSSRLYSNYRVSMIVKEIEDYSFYYLQSWTGWSSRRGIIHIDENVMKKLEKLQKGEEVYDEVEEVRI